MSSDVAVVGKAKATKKTAGVCRWGVGGNGLGSTL